MRAAQQKLDPAKNETLAGCFPAEFERLQPHFQSTTFHAGDVLFDIGAPIRYVYFPQSGVYSSLVTMEDGRSVDVGVTGSEGVIGLEALFGAKESTRVAVVLTPGDCVRLKLETALAEFRTNARLRDRILRYTSNFLSQVMQTAACNRVHRVEQRLARWLLMIHDRVKRDEFPLTHESLSYMLGSPRPEVTIAAGILRKAGLLSYARGSITIFDRQGLEAACCECYGAVHQEISGRMERFAALEAV